jgi:hypothetical protein
MIDLAIDFHGNTDADFYGGRTIIVQTSVVPNTVTLNGTTFALELDGYREASQDTLTASVVRSGQPDDELFNTEGAWWRYRSAWNGGAGRPNADLDRNIDPTTSVDQSRFDTSRHLDVWTERELRLLPDVAAWGAVEATTKAFLVHASSNLYYVRDVGGAVKVDRYSTVGGAATVVTGTMAGTLKDATTDGSKLYVATSSNLYQISGTAATVLTGGAHTMCVFVSSRLLVGNNNVVYETASNGTRTSFFTHFSATFVWTGAVQVGSRIYLFGTAFDKTEVLLLTTTSTGVLAVSSEALALPFTETVNTIIQHAGILMICTNKGVRLGVTAGDGALSYGPLISAPGEVKCGASDGGYGWFGWSDLGDSKAGLGRWDFTNFSDAALLPAYASDLAITSAASTTLAVARFDGKTVFVDATLGLQHEGTGFEVEGTMETGEFFFGTVEDKLFNTATIRIAPLVVSESVTAEAFIPVVGSITSSQAVAEGATKLQLTLTSAQTPSLRMQIKLAGDGTSTPTVSQFRLRGYPVVPLVREWILPLKLRPSSIVNTGHGIPLSMDVETVFDGIVEHVISREAVLMAMGDRTWSVRLDAYQFAPDQWRDTGDILQGILTVKAIGV